jgi:hypothetical protein
MSPNQLISVKNPELDGGFGRRAKEKGGKDWAWGLGEVSFVANESPAPALIRSNGFSLEGLRQLALSLFAAPAS